ncbi:hypothetical protein DIPPA_33965 [Diplonema papillatum]|nr:hypothetical protein DIPPA_33965 [Diplonema papillatum]
MATSLPPSVLRSAQDKASYSASLGKFHIGDEHDLTTHDGKITEYSRADRHAAVFTLVVSGVSSAFAGFRSGNTCQFNLKSSIAQLGVDARDCKVTLDAAIGEASVSGHLIAVSSLGVLLLDFLGVGAYIGKVFAEDPSRRVVSLEYIKRLIPEKDLRGNPLLVYQTGGNKEDWSLKVVDGRVVAFIPVKPGVYRYSGEIHTLLPTAGRALKEKAAFKPLLHLHQEFKEGFTRVAVPDEILMVQSYPMHCRTMFARVVDSLLPPGVRCASSNIMDPDLGFDERGSRDGRKFVFVGSSTQELTHVPLEFFSLEAHRESVPMSKRVGFTDKARDPETLFKAFATMPKNKDNATTFICKGSMFDELTEDDWLTSQPKKVPFVGGSTGGEQQRQLAERYLFQQCEYSILSAISMGDISSEGVLLSRYYPSPVLKSLILSRQVGKKLRAVYFTVGSKDYGAFMSQEDRSMLADLDLFGIQVYFVDQEAKRVYQFMQRVGNDNGLFVPLPRCAEYMAATFFGVYGSNLVAGDFEAELKTLLGGVLELKAGATHPMLNKDKPLALVTGGGPGAMEVGNRVAHDLGILSCGMFVDFGSLSRKPGVTINEQKKNPFVEAFMTYRPQKLVERQSDFNLDFPIFLTGGIGTDFEYALEEVRRKVGTVAPNPVILFGTPEHWGAKITPRFLENRKSGTIKGSEWLSNVPYVVSSGAEALAVLTHFFKGTLPIGPAHPGNDLGFMVAASTVM